MSEPPIGALPGAAPQPDPRVPRVRRAVKILAGFVVLSLLGALAMAAINIVTDRPAKEVFVGPGADPVLVDSPFGAPPADRAPGR